MFDFFELVVFFIVDKQPAQCHMAENAQKHISENAWIDIFPKATFSFTTDNDILKCLQVGLKKIVGLGVVKAFVELNIEQKDFEKITIVEIQTEMAFYQPSEFSLG